MKWIFRLAVLREVKTRLFAWSSGAGQSTGRIAVLQLILADRNLAALNSPLFITVFLEAPGAEFVGYACSIHHLQVLVSALALKIQQAMGECFRVLCRFSVVI